MISCVYQNTDDEVTHFDSSKFNSNQIFFSNTLKNISFTLRDHTLPSSSVCSGDACECCGGVVHWAGLKPFEIILSVPT